jgi:predicted nucleic acid-binding protein
MSGEFCDTNILVYANDRSAGEKYRQALRLVTRLWHSGTGVVSLQVLQELYVTLTRKLPLPLSAQEARTVVEELVAWTVVEPTKHDVLLAIDGASRWQISFGDAMLLSTAKKAGVDVLWSEDLSHGQDFDGVVVRNPFLPTSANETPAEASTEASGNAGGDDGDKLAGGGH